MGWEAVIFCATNQDQQWADNGFCKLNRDGLLPLSFANSHQFLEPDLLFWPRSSELEF